MKPLASILFLMMILFSPILMAAENSAHYNQKGLYHLGKKSYKKAEVNFLRAIKIDGKNKYYYNNIAIAQLKLKKYARAYKNLLKAVKIDPNYVKAYSNLAIVCFYLGKYEVAYGYYQKAKEIDSKYMNKRFTKDRAKKEINRLHRENPSNEDYKKMNQYMEKL